MDGWLIGRSATRRSRLFVNPVPVALARRNLASTPPIRALRAPLLGYPHVKSGSVQALALPVSPTPSGLSDAASFPRPRRPGRRDLAPSDNASLTSS